ncbi:MAG: hypothetical protein KDI90_11140 [Alphaproteobacteria bacterium]|nr:hypothetical protein [Alphaproteobacteria bacterium]MCB9974892.1 hypothetical protein [Rhodospirillales bacterium]
MGMLTQIFMYQRPRSNRQQQEFLARQRTIVETLPETIGDGDVSVLRALNEYGAIARLGQDFHTSEHCLKLYETLIEGGYEISPQLGEYFDAGDDGQIALYLIGQAMEELREGRPPQGIFVTRSSMALNGVPPGEWQHVIDREILMI